MIHYFILKKYLKSISLLNKPGITNQLFQSKLKITSTKLSKLINKLRIIRTKKIMSNWK